MRIVARLWSQRNWLFIVLLLCLSACRTPPEPRTTAVFSAEKLAEMDTAIREAITNKQLPGGVLWLERNGVAYHRAYGYRALVPAAELMTEDTIFDAASLTKVVATTPAIMRLIERGLVKLDAPVQAYIPEFKGAGKEAITVRQLLTHTSGLLPDIDTRTKWSGESTAIRMACEERLQSAPGTAFRYSDINLFLAGEIVQRASGRRLEEFVSSEIYQPLRMVDTGYLPPMSKLARIAPTEVVSGVPWRGVVHDPTARFMGGVAGHAGLFTTAGDLARYARMLLNLGELEGVRIFKPETVRLMTSVQTMDAIAPRRGLGWDIDSSYSGPRGAVFPIGSYGHTGWTGTSIWVDPFSRTFVIFLSNRNHPTEKGSVVSLRAKLGTLAAQAVIGFDFTNVLCSLTPRPVTRTGVVSRIANSPAQGRAKVFSGIDVLVKQKFAPLRGLRVGLITNQTGHDRDRNSTIDLLKDAPGVKLTALFSPEHGIRGVLDAEIGDSLDAKTGLPIYSLYGERRKPTPEQLKDLDALVYDIQDIGCRFYTYPSTMGLAMQAAAEAGKKIFVLDRPNPINGVTVDGPVVTEETSFVGFHKIPLRHGMTVGELARMFNAEKDYRADLTVIACEGWTRRMWFDEIGLPWTNPSPNMRNLTAATFYPGVGLLETALSVGRGTDTPFELVGAPYIDGPKLAQELNASVLPGVRFMPTRFTPASSVHKDQPCGGVHILLTDRDRCRAVDVGLQIAQTLFRLYPKEFDPDKMQRLLLHQRTLDDIKAGKALNEVRASWQADLDEFQKRRARYLIYG